MVISRSWSQTSVVEKAKLKVAVVNILSDSAPSRAAVAGLTVVENRIHQSQFAKYMQL